MDWGIDLKETEDAEAILVGVFKGSDRETCEEHLDELEELANTFGVPTLAKIACPIRKMEAATLLGEGKLAEVKERLEETGATLVIFDDEISPAQQRNLEKYFDHAVMDRTELILEIFAQRAHTKEATLQVELARTKYTFPRLKRLWSHFSRQRASGGYLKGEGEKQLELDKRMLQNKLQRLEKELKGIKKARTTQRSARLRAGVPTFAIVGYTNAGKSTLLNALTEAGVFVEDKLFATLDPTTRKFTLPNNEEVLLTDTVGFIRKLPHTLVAAFRSTLEAALHDDVLLHVIDVSHPYAEDHAASTRELLEELNADIDSVVTLLNKVDLCEDPARIQRLRMAYPKTVLISARERTGFDDLTDVMMRELAARRKELKLTIPQSEYALVSELRREGRVHYEEYEGNDVILRVDVPLNLVHKVEKYVESSEE